MFKVKDNKGRIFTVFDVSYDSNGYPSFLIFDNHQWHRYSAKHYTPIFPRESRKTYG